MGRPYSVGMNKIAKVLVDYYIFNKRQCDIASELEIGRTTVSYYTRKYRRVMYKVISECREKFANNRNAFLSCVNKKIMDILILRYGRKPKRRVRKVEISETVS